MTGTPLRDVISIPERISAGDYVLKLTEGVQDAADVPHHGLDRHR